MARWMPFTAHLKLHPARPEKRVERVRELQTIARLIYLALQADPLLNIAMPGGGQVANEGEWSNLVYGTAVKPQIGESPAQAMVTGFYNIEPDVVSSPAPPAADLLPAKQNQVQLIHSNQWVTGPYNQTPYKSNPDPVIQHQVKALVALLENTANAGLPDRIEPVTVFRLDYANIVYGDRGHSFPR